MMHNYYLYYIRYSVGFGVCPTSILFLVEKKTIEVCAEILNAWTLSFILTIWKEKAFKVVIIMLINCYVVIRVKSILNYCSLYVLYKIVFCLDL